MSRFLEVQGLVLTKMASSKAKMTSSSVTGAKNEWKAITIKQLRQQRSASFRVACGPRKKNGPLEKGYYKKVDLVLKKGYHVFLT